MTTRFKGHVSGLQWTKSNRDKIVAYLFRLYAKLTERD